MKWGARAGRRHHRAVQRPDQPQLRVPVGEPVGVRVPLGVPLPVCVGVRVLEGLPEALAPRDRLAVGVREVVRELESLAGVEGVGVGV